MRCVDAERCNRPPVSGAPTSTDPSTGGRHRPAGCRARNLRTGLANPPPTRTARSGAALSGPTGRPRPPTAPTGRYGRTAPSHRCSPPAPTARSDPCRRHRPLVATRARPRRPTGRPLARTTVPARPSARPRVPTGRPPAGTRTPPPHDGCAEWAGPRPVGAPARTARPRGHRRTRPPGGGRRARGGDAGQGQRPIPAAPLRNRLGGARRTPAPADGRASTPGCGPSVVPRRWPAGRASSSGCSSRWPASRPRNSTARARRRRVPRADQRRPRAEPPTPVPTVAGRRRRVRPAHGPTRAAGWRCDSAHRRRTDRPEAPARAHPTRRSAGARAGCPPRVPSPGNSRPECDPSEPKAESAVQV